MLSIFMGFFSNLASDPVNSLFPTFPNFNQQVMYKFQLSLLHAAFYAKKPLGESIQKSQVVVHLYLKEPLSIFRF